MFPQTQDLPNAAVVDNATVQMGRSFLFDFSKGDFVVNGDNCVISSNISNEDSATSISNYGDHCIISSNTCITGDGTGIYNSGDPCIISGNTCISGDSAFSNNSHNCTIYGNTFSCNGLGSGIYSNGGACTISGNICNSNEGTAIYNINSTANKCVISGNVCVNGGISVKTGTCLPATQLAMADVNTGSITIRA